MGEAELLHERGMVSGIWGATNQGDGAAVEQGSSGFHVGRTQQDRHGCLRLLGVLGWTGRFVQGALFGCRLHSGFGDLVHLYQIVHDGITERVECLPDVVLLCAGEGGSAEGLEGLKGTFEEGLIWEAEVQAASEREKMPRDRSEAQKDLLFVLLPVGGSWLEL